MSLLVKTQVDRQMRATTPTPLRFHLRPSPRSCLRAHQVVTLPRTACRRHRAAEAPSLCRRWRKGGCIFGAQAGDFRPRRSVSVMGAGEMRRRWEWVMSGDRRLGLIVGEQVLRLLSTCRIKVLHGLVEIGLLQLRRRTLRPNSSATKPSGRCP